MNLEKHKCYAISSYNSGSMQSSNPHSGIYETTISRILDLNGGNPACYQGGVIILEATRGHNSGAICIDAAICTGGGGTAQGKCWYENRSATLKAGGVHAVAYTLKIRCGCDTYTKWNGKKGTAGKGALIQIEKSATLAVVQDQVLFQPADVRGGEQRER